MASTSEQARVQVKASWARAHKLAAMADVKASVARSYIKDHPEAVAILRNGNDKRSPTVRSMIDGCKAHSGANKAKQNLLDIAKTGIQRKTKADYRASQGNPTKQPRAGAPNPIIAECGGGIIPNQMVLPGIPNQSLQDTIASLQAWKDRHDALGQKIQNCIEALEDQQTYAGG